MFRISFAFLCVAALPVSAGVAQIHADANPFNFAVAPYIAPPAREKPAQPMRVYPRFDDDLVRIYFEYGSAHLSATAKQIVAIAAAKARRCGYERITIAGHTDDAYIRSRAIGLSRQMGETVKRSLMARGMDPARISVEAYGYSRPAIDSERGAREPFNRRIEMEIRCPGDTGATAGRNPAPGA